MEKMAVLISIGEEDQIFPQLPEFERDAIICHKLYPNKESGEISEQELSEIKKLCKDASATVFIVDSNNASDLLCMKYLADYYSQNNADYIVVVCRFEREQCNNEVLRYICQKANGIYLIEDNYTYWDLAMHICSVINAFLLHIYAPESSPEYFERVRKVFPRQSNQILEILTAATDREAKRSVLDKFLDSEEKVQKLKSAHTGYCLITPSRFENEEQVDSIGKKLNKILAQEKQIAGFIQLKSKTYVSEMFVVTTKKAETLFG